MHRVVIKYKSSYITKIYVLFIIFTLEYYSLEYAYELRALIIHNTKSSRTSVALFHHRIAYCPVYSSPFPTENCECSLLPALSSPPVLVYIEPGSYIGSGSIGPH